MARKTAILIAGPTASGKTALAVSIARRLRTAVISADSRQCFREMNIGVAKPSRDELSAVKHYFVNSHSIFENVNAGVFERYALDAANEIFRYNDYLVVTGGTGLYIKAFCEGLDDIPSIPPIIRERIMNEYANHGLAWLQKETALQDPLYFQTGETSNPQRLMRALEVKAATGRSILELQGRKVVSRPFDIVKYAIDIPREVLYQRINARVEDMVNQGLVEEARGLYQHRSLNALQTVGYSEIFASFSGETDLETAIEKIKQNSRHYAKRQITWFRHQPDYTWIKPPFDDVDDPIFRRMLE